MEEGAGEDSVIVFSGRSQCLTSIRSGDKGEAEQGEGDCAEALGLVPGMYCCVTSYPKFNGL